MGDPARVFSPQGGVRIATSWRELTLEWVMRKCFLDLSSNCCPALNAAWHMQNSRPLFGAVKE
jgi:hypothetical protein